MDNRELMHNAARSIDGFMREHHTEIISHFKNGKLSVTIYMIDGLSVVLVNWKNVFKFYLPASHSNTIVIELSRIESTIEERKFPC